MDIRRPSSIGAITVMSDYDQWLEFQGGCYEELPCCEQCGYELCKHAVCRHCIGCANCDAEEAAEQVAKKPPASESITAKQQKIG